MRAWVHGYFASSSYLPAPLRERHLPSTEVPLLLNFGAPHRRQEEGGWSTHDSAWIVGLHAKHQLTEAAGERHFMVVRFTPLGAHLFFRMPMHLIANQAVDLASIDPALARRLKDVSVANSWSSRFDAMESLIAERLGDAEISADVDFVWGKLVASDGQASLGALAAQLDCSHRVLIEKFRDCIGMPPKTVARLLRFNRALVALNDSSATRAGEPAGKPYVESPNGGGNPVGTIAWADIAADSGYFDQAHFIRDFRAFAGTTPARFLRQIAPLA